MWSLAPVVLAAALIARCCLLSTALMPTGDANDDVSSPERDALASLLENELTGDLTGEGKTRGPRVIVVASPNLLKDLRALNVGSALYKRRVDAPDAAATSDLNIPILRRDSMRCMVGRVYRPCWEV